MDSTDGESQEQPLDLHDVVVFETDEGQRLEFSVVAIVEDSGERYAIGYNADLDDADERDDPDDSEGFSPFVVTDMHGRLLEDADLAQEILDEFEAEELLDGDVLSKDGK
jgi:hypothetical protein